MDSLIYDHATASDRPRETSVVVRMKENPGMKCQNKYYKPGRSGLCRAASFLMNAPGLDSINAPIAAESYATRRDQLRANKIPPGWGVGDWEWKHRAALGFLVSHHTC